MSEGPRHQKADFARLQEADRRAERRILYGEIALLAAIALVSFLYLRLTA